MRNNSKNHRIPGLFFFILAAVIGYLIGSFPTAYLLVKWKARLDIRSVGGGNVGARNTLDITGSKLLGFIVLLIDIVKGAFAVWFSTQLGGQNFWFMSVAGIASIIGHNYSIWIQWEGGRGLATSVGVFLLLGWIFIALWCVSWLALYLGPKNIHIANVLATIISAVAVLLIPEQLLCTTLPAYTTIIGFRCIVISVSLLILLRHIQPLTEICKSLYAKYSS
jgi:acyl phosphate:glycerol-3-phosphate acyltransferase